MELFRHISLFYLYYINDIEQDTKNGENYASVTHCAIRLIISITQYCSGDKIR